ncbi:MAG: hypothetical protein D4R79_16615 [Comamonadaceae bacterium]|nr:MAG: hypothetical protein D4R79_16615 [Comamonadaceae bacterium]
MVTTSNAFTSVAPVKAPPAVPAKAVAPTKSPVPAKKVVRNAAANKVVKKATPITKTGAKKVVRTVAKKPVTALPKGQTPVAAAPIVKALAKPAATKAVKPKAAKPVKEKKPKLVRDSFTIPKAEYSLLDELKQRAGKLASPVKKSELLRAGIKALATMTDSAFLIALKAVPAIRTGRPNKD